MLASGGHQGNKPGSHLPAACSAGKAPVGSRVKARRGGRRTIPSGWDGGVGGARRALAVGLFEEALADADG
jgi:hypothetical protein